MYWNRTASTTLVHFPTISPLSAVTWTTTPTMSTAAKAAHANSVTKIGSGKDGCMMGTYTDPNRTASRADIRDRGGCFECPINHYCNGGSELPFPCQIGSGSPIGSVAASQCQCSPGRYAHWREGIYDGTRILPRVMTCESCPLDSYCNGNGLIQSCGIGQHWRSSIGSTSPHNCTCEPGFYPSTSWTCVSCEPNSECHDGFLHHCQSHSWSEAGSTSCQCLAGTYLTKSGQCQVCESNFYCIGGHISPAACPLASISSMGSTGIDQCRCPQLGYYLRIQLPNNNVDGEEFNQMNRYQYMSTCELCQSGHYCDTTNSTMIPCGDHQQSPIGSTTILNCTCESGWARSKNDHCFRCPVNSWCYGDIVHACAPGAVSEEGSSWCRCMPGTFGDPHVNCFICPLGFYCNTNDKGGGVVAVANATKCEDGKSTRSTGARDSSECICAPGTLFKNNVCRRRFHLPNHHFILQC
jgi:hypothetical protein